ncbi:MAG: PhzF family phenazine biosynthesis protein [Actinomycetota bacterium]
MEFWQIDVFADGPYQGNPLAVFPEAAGLRSAQMQAISREMNLSETTFVTATDGESYDVRIFTPTEELPFAGHPTIGTAWTLRRLDRISGDVVVQRSRAGETKVTASGDLLWFERTGEADDDLTRTHPQAEEDIARALGVAASDVGLEARELGRSGLLRPSYSDAGVRQLMVPLKDLSALGRCSPRADLLARLGALGAYCFTATGAGSLRSRGFFPGAGVAEDPATGSAAAALGIYLAERLGAIDAEISQGVEIGRPSRISLRAEPGRARIGGRCHLVLTGRLEKLPS